MFMYPYANDDVEWFGISMCHGYQDRKMIPIAIFRWNNGPLMYIATAATVIIWLL